MIRSLLKILTNAWLTVISARQWWDRFEIIWNVPSEQCESHYTIPVQEYGILVNDRQKFYGNNIVTLYEEKFGLYPYYRNFSDPKSAINGGIPQRASIKAHLSKVRLDIAKAMPNRSFDGLAIVDYEKWRPLWEHNWYTKRIYQRESVAYVKQRYKSISDRSAELIAINEFNRAAMKFLLATINEAKRMRPYALWGFYGIPFCNYSAGMNGTVGCGVLFEEFNDRLQPLYTEATALYPSIYLPSRRTDNVNCLYVTSVLQEAIRCAEKLTSRKPIFAFTGIEYFPLNPSDPFYTEHDLYISLAQVLHMGLQGAIIWSTSTKMRERCGGIANFVRKHIGPLKKFAKSFIQMKYKGNGRYPLREQFQPYYASLEMLDIDKKCFGAHQDFFKNSALKIW